MIDYALFLYMHEISYVNRCIDILSFFNKKKYHVYFHNGYFHYVYYHYAYYRSVTYWFISS